MIFQENVHMTDIVNNIQNFYIPLILFSFELVPCHIGWKPKIVVPKPLTKLFERHVSSFPLVPKLTDNYSVFTNQRHV